MHFNIKSTHERHDPLREKFELIKNGTLPISALGEVLKEEELPKGAYEGDTFFSHILSYMPQYAKDAVALFHQTDDKSIFDVLHTNTYGKNVFDVALEKGFHSVIHFYFSNLTDYPLVVANLLVKSLSNNAALFLEFCKKYHIEHLNYSNANGLTLLDIAVSTQFDLIDFVAEHSSVNSIYGTISKLKSNQIQAAIHPDDYNNDYGPATKQAIKKLESRVISQEKKELDSIIEAQNSFHAQTLKI